MPEQVEQTVEEKFRAALLDVVEIATKLQPFCENIDELIDMVKAALKSKGNLRMLVETIKGG